MTFWQQESLRMRVVATCPSTFPCLFPAPCLQVQGGRQMVHCALLVSSAHHKPSPGGRSNNEKHLDKGREKAANRITCGVCAGTTPALQAEAGWFPIAGNTPCARIS